MKKFIYLVMFILLFPMQVIAEEIMYDDAIDMVQEVMKQYYIRGPYIQYNYARVQYSGLNPEDATSQDNRYTVCAGYTHNVYNQAFGIKGSGSMLTGDNIFKDDSFPIYNYQIIYAAHGAYNKIKVDGNKSNGTLLLYYQSNVSTPDDNSDGYTREREVVKYVYGDTTEDNSNDLGILIKNVRPGDLFVYTGHALIAYDVVDTNGDGEIDDVLILNSTGGSNIKSRIESTAQLYYHVSKTSKSTKFLNLEKEGTIKLTYLSNLTSSFVKDGKLNCKYDECAVIRPFYKGNDGKAIFNFKQSVDKDSTVAKKTSLRVKYPGLVIEKTVNVGDNNSVNVSDELEYTIKIINKSIVDNKGDVYKNFSVEETLSDLVSFVEANENGSFNNNEKKIIWNINGLSAGNSITLTYKARVTGEVSKVGKIIKSEGSFYDGNKNNGVIPTGIVENKIIPKVSIEKNKYQECFDNNKSKYSGLDLINEIYKCAALEDFKFNNFDFKKLYTKTFKTKASSKINIKDDLDVEHTKFQKMILNNYFSGLVWGTQKNETIYYFAIWGSNTTSSGKRAKTINSSDFKDGDILIYDIETDELEYTPKKSKFTNEKGYYAYIFINGQFIGVNGNGCTERNTFSSDYYKTENWTNSSCSTKLNVSEHLYNGNWNNLTAIEKEFVNYQTLYGKDNYIILRPTQAIREVINVKLTKPNKLQYLQNYENLDLAGGKVTVEYNDGTTDNIELTDSNVSVSGFDNSKNGTQIITVEYNGYTTSFDVSVLNNIVENENDNESDDEFGNLIVNPQTGIKEVFIYIIAILAVIVSFVVYKKKMTGKGLN